MNLNAAINVQLCISLSNNRKLNITDYSPFYSLTALGAQYSIGRSLKIPLITWVPVGLKNP